MEYRQELGIGTKLKVYLGIDGDYNEHQCQLARNVKHCANSQWQWVNSYYDGDQESSWKFFENAKNVYNTIYEESAHGVFGPGYESHGKTAEAQLKNTKFAGKAFKDKVVLYFTAKLYEEAVDEIEFSDEQKKRVLNDLLELKQEIGG